MDHPHQRGHERDPIREDGVAKHLVRGERPRNDAEEQQGADGKDGEVPDVIPGSVEAAHPVVDGERGIHRRPAGDGRLERRHQRVSERTADRLIRHDRGIVVPDEWRAERIEIGRERDEQDQCNRNDPRQASWRALPSRFGHRLTRAFWTTIHGNPKRSRARVTLPTRRALLHGLYLGLSLLFASRFFAITHPTSFAITEGDPALMVWTLQWVTRALVHDPLHVFAGNTFFPYAHSIVLTDSMVTLAVANAPVRLFTSNPWVGYDLLIVAAYYLSCVFGSALARELTQSEAAAVWGGIFWGFLFYRVHHIGHLQILSFQFIPAAMLALLRFWRAPGTGRALLFVLAFVAQALVSWYLAVITVLILLVVLMFRPWHEIVQWPRAKYYLPIVVVSAAVILPLARPYRAAFNDSTLAERRALINTFGDAVRPADYFTPPDATLAGRLVPKNPYWIWGENTLYVGFVPLFLAMTGVASTFKWTRSAVVSDGPAEAGRHVRTVITAIALVVVGYVLALGFVSPRLGISLP